VRIYLPPSALEESLALGGLSVPMSEPVYFGQSLVRDLQCFAAVAISGSTCLVKKMSFRSCRTRLLDHLVESGKYKVDLERHPSTSNSCSLTALPSRLASVAAVSWKRLLIFT
jgi:hypothetical protein